MSGLPSWFTSITVGDIVTTVLAFIALFAAVMVVVRPLRQSLRRMLKLVEQISEDWHGVPGRPGFPAIPGVPERLAMLEERSKKDRELLERIDHEMHPNSGSSLRDAVNKAVSDVDVVRRGWEKREAELTRLANDVAAVTRTLGNPRALRALAQRIDREDEADDDQQRGA